MISFKKFKKEYLLKFINKTNPVIFDVGCYDGKDSIEFFNIFDNPSVYCFDPFPKITPILSSYVESKKIILTEIALSHQDGLTNFYQSNNHSASSSLNKPKDHLRIFKDVSFEEIKEVNNLKLDTWVKNNFDKEEIDLLWIDVNGAEKSFLLGAAETIKKTNIIFIEFSSTESQKLYEGGITYEQILSMLPDFNLIEIYDFMGNYGNLLLINKTRGLN